MPVAPTAEPLQPILLYLVREQHQAREVAAHAEVVERVLPNGRAAKRASGRGVVRHVPRSSEFVSCTRCFDGPTLSRLVRADMKTTGRARR